jgi:hypothetical protein
VYRIPGVVQDEGVEDCAEGHDGGCVEGGRLEAVDAVDGARFACRVGMGVGVMVGSCRGRGAVVS